MDASSPSVVACRSSRRTKMTETFESLFSDCSEPSFRRLKAKRRQAANSETWLKRLDRVQTLGSGSERSHYTESASYGHVGCVNALAWTTDGSILASGSDDFRICLWKVGHDPSHIDPVNDVEGFCPKLSLGLSTIVHTGHTRNIFSVKWLPYTSNTRLVSCAGDARVKVFDISRTGSMTPVQHQGKEWNEYQNGSALLHQFRCHTDRVKRISLEDSPDCFLTVSEDATVRQFDLREPHVCDVPTRSTCPTPLADYSEYGISLYTLSVSKLRPELFVCAGTSSFAYLHDRRMGRAQLQEWGVPLKKGVTSQCVRRFGLEDPATVAKPDTRHITAVKLSEINGRDLVVSYSDGPVALFDIFDDPVSSSVAPDQSNSSQAKRKRSDTSMQEESRPTKVEKSEQDVPTLRAQVIEALRFDQPVEGEPSSEISPLTITLLDQLLSMQKKDAGARIGQAYCALLAKGAEAAHAELALVRDDREPSNFPALLDILTPREDTSKDERNQLFRSACADALRELWTEQAPLIKVKGLEPSDRRMEFEVAVGDNGELMVQYTLGEEEGLESEVTGSEEDPETDFEESELDDSSEEEEGGAETGLPPTMYRQQRASRRQQANADVPLVVAHRTFTGHLNSQTVKEVNLGFLDEFVLSGSDDGRLFLFDKHTSEVIQILEGDRAVVNVALPHPDLPILAVSGIDSSVKIFAPTNTFPRRFSALADKAAIIRANMSSRGRNQEIFAPDTNFLSLIARRLVREREVDSPTEGGGQGTIMLSPADLRRLIQEEGEEGEENCIVS